MASRCCIEVSVGTASGSLPLLGSSDETVAPAIFLGGFVGFGAMVETQTGRRIKRVRSDQAKEFHSGRVSALMQESCIVFEASAMYAHEQNGKAERMNRTISDMARTKMIDAGLPETMLVEAFRTACYIRNRMVS